MSANGISTLATKDLRQVAKLDLAETKRQAGGNTNAPEYRHWNIYSLTHLPAPHGAWSEATVTYDTDASNLTAIATYDTDVSGDVVNVQIINGGVGYHGTSLNVTVEDDGSTCVINFTIAAGVITVGTPGAVSSPFTISQVDIPIVMPLTIVDVINVQVLNGGTGYNSNFSVIVTDRVNDILETCEISFTVAGGVITVATPGAVSASFTPAKLNVPVTQIEEPLVAHRPWTSSTNP